MFVICRRLDETARLEAQEMLKAFVLKLTKDVMTIMGHRLTSEDELQNTRASEQRDELIKALDRLYRKLMAMGTLIPTIDFAP